MVAGREYQVVVANPPLSHRCSAFLIALDCEFVCKHVHVHEFGVVVTGTMHDMNWVFACLHFPHQQRPDAPEVWERGISSLLNLLSGCSWQTNILIGHDLNQNLHASVDEFVGMLHYREFVFQTSLNASPDLGDTWVARGSSSPIDFYLHQIRGAETSFHKREDYRIALPSDHNAVGIEVVFRDKTVRHRRKRPPRTLCGKWQVACEPLLEHLKEQDVWDDSTLCRAFRAPGVSSQPPTLRYRDPEEVRELIRSRSQSRDEWQRAALMQEIHQRRTEAKAAHKQMLLDEARSGNCRAIAHMRASANGGKTEGSYIQRCGGVERASEDLFLFYEKKFLAHEGPPTVEQLQALQDLHSAQPSADVTTEEIFRAMRGARNGVSAGLDGTTYEGFRHLLLQDKQNRIPKYFSDIIRGIQPVPPSWKRGKIVLLPKVTRPSQPKDLRPICLTPVLGRIFSKVLMTRVHQFAPPYSGHQIGCRPGVQAADGIMAAQATLQLLKQTRGQAFVAKVDIKAAFDSLSQNAVLRWLRSCRPAIECHRLYELLSGTSVDLCLGGESRTIRLGRGLMQGTAYSADVFSRVMDFFLTPLHEEFDRSFEEWNQPPLGLPHFIIYADDIILFADSEVSLQRKLQAVVDSLAPLGLEVNPEKSKVMTCPDGSSPGVWLRGRAEPVAVEDSLVFLGVPLMHSHSPHRILTHLLRKTSNAYYGFKRLMDSGHAPVGVRLLIFSTFITAKWAWASPLLIPTKQALRRIESAKNTFLLSLFRLPTDPLLSWTDNTISRRRAVRYLCKANRGPDWRATWLQRQWAYLGHLARTAHRQPMQKLLAMCSSNRVGTSIRASWVSDLLIRRVQRIYSTWPWAQSIPHWEQFAQDRTQWANHAHWWVRHWVAPDPPVSFELLMERQLIVLSNSKGILDCFLRPSKDFTDVPYSVPMHVIKPAKVNGPFLWAYAHNGRCALICSRGGMPSRSVLVHAVAHDATLQAVSVCALRLALKVRGILAQWGHLLPVFFPKELLQRSVFHGHVPLVLLSESTEALNLLDRQGLDHLHLEPVFKSGSPWLVFRDGISLPPLHTKYLVRDNDFTEAFFCDGAQQLSDALFHMFLT